MDALKKAEYHLQIVTDLKSLKESHLPYPINRATEIRKEILDQLAKPFESLKFTYSLRCSDTGEGVKYEYISRSRIHLILKIKI